MLPADKPAPLHSLGAGELELGLDTADRLAGYDG